MMAEMVRTNKGFLKKEKENEIQLPGAFDFLNPSSWLKKRNKLINLPRKWEVL